VLLEHAVEMVVIGGVAAVARGVDYGTSDLDIAADRDAANLNRLNFALLAMNAGIRKSGPPEPLHRLSTGDWLAPWTFWNFVTDFGAFDVLFAPAGIDSYVTLAASAEPLDLGDGVIAPVASVADLIRMKAAADRPKDRQILDALRDILSADESSHDSRT
jgi:hypothetical protein